ncbi:MAG: hypothetical protein QM640_12020 [Niabella sp.]
MKTYNRSVRIYLIAIALFAIICSSCSKAFDNDDANQNNNTNISAAAAIAGTYTGTGKWMPDNIHLGIYSGCVAPDGWDSNFKTGTATVNVTKITDSTVTITLAGPYPTTSYSPVTVKAGNAQITFSTGYYDTNSKFLTLSARTGRSRGYITSNACLSGLPYYSGWSALINNQYDYYTIDHVDFSGTKQ